MMKICLIRHGETAWNANGIIQGLTDTDLNDIGRNQAEACANFLSKQNWDLILTSPLRRAKNTASILANKMGQNVKVMEEFVEKHYGDAVGSPLINQTSYAEAGEQSILFKKRVLAGFRQLKENYFNKKIILVTHGDVIQVILTSLFDSNEFNQTVKNASISELELTGNKWVMNSFNNNGYSISFTNKKSVQ
ncbi:histidine phosphatase family protein [Neobacillus novalis]|uniref:Histidine phosphatase family protein n=1 Tax=Neobacillus novalis TaxID=220687 RepID=A0AA95MHY0_9BACI|nr:histidine phosphatase family protein [Neobacillus novalis]WHY83915.1 histidine phosphatase family protein [Neobacillus novalis]